MKSEPDAYGIDDLRREGTTLWDGIRNYQARNFMRSMEVETKHFLSLQLQTTRDHRADGGDGDRPGGPTQFDPTAKYYDPKSSPEKPRWDCARLRFLGEFDALLSLDQLRELYSEEQLPVIKRGNRLSILPVPTDTANDLLSRLGQLH